LPKTQVEFDAISGRLITVERKLVHDEATLTAPRPMAAPSHGPPRSGAPGGFGSRTGGSAPGGFGSRSGGWVEEAGAETATQAVAPAWLWRAPDGWGHGVCC